MNAIFMIEGGRPLEMVKEHIAERRRVWTNVKELAKELGVENISTDVRTGVLLSVVFPRHLHCPEFAKPKKRNGLCSPKKGTDWARRFQEQVGYRDPAEWVSSEFSIPTSMSYTGDEMSGSHCFGNFLRECGFLWLSANGPYAMWAPDVEWEVEQYRSKGYEVADPAGSFRFAIDGARRIEKEEWEILVLQNKLAAKEKVAA